MATATATASATATATATPTLPNWVMMERFIFRRDDPSSFREDERTSVTSTTSTGARFSVSFNLAEPPTPSRLYICWPDGPKWSMMCHLVTAHHHLVLLRLDSIVLQPNEVEPSTFGIVLHDYFVYIAGPPSQHKPSLKRLVAPTWHSQYYGKPITRPFDPLTVGLLCLGEEEFVVAHLDMHRPQDAELWVLRSSVLPSSDDSSTGGGEKWEIKHLPIQYQGDEDIDLFNWVAHEVVPFENSLCWVNYTYGIMFCDDVGGDSPKVSYLRLPLDRFPRHPPHRTHDREWLRRSLCVTEVGRRLVLVDVTCDYGTDLGPMACFTITSWTVVMTEHGAKRWSQDYVVKAHELWDQNSTIVCLPRVPLLSADKPNVAYLALYNRVAGAGKVSLVTIDLKEKQVVGSIVPYIHGEEDLRTDDADLAKSKPSFFAHFLPTEFSKFLNPSRKRKSHG